MSTGRRDVIIQRRKDNGAEAESGKLSLTKRSELSRLRAIEILELRAHVSAITQFDIDMALTIGFTNMERKNHQNLCSLTHTHTLTYYLPFAEDCTLHRYFRVDCHAMLNQNVHTCVDVWVTKREKEEPFLNSRVCPVAIFSHSCASGASYGRAQMAQGS